MNGDVKAALILATADIIINQGLTALAKFVNDLNGVEKTPVTLEDIEKVKGELDSASYFEK